MSETEEVAKQFEREFLAVDDWSHRQSQGDEDPLEFTLAIKAPVSTTTDPDAADITNSLSFPLQGIQQDKRKSESTHHLTPEPAEKPRTGIVNSGIAINPMEASAEFNAGKLRRPARRVIRRGPVAQVKRDIFELETEHQGKQNPPDQGPTGAKRGRPPQKREPATTKDEPDVPSTLPAAASKAEPDKPAKVPNSKREGKRPGAGRKGRDQGVGNRAKPSQEPGLRQPRSGNPVAALSSRHSPHSISRPEIGRSTSADQHIFVQESRRPGRDEALNDQKFNVSSGFDQPPVATEHDNPSDSEPKVFQQLLVNNENKSNIRDCSQPPVGLHEVNNDGRDDHSGDINMAEDQEYERGGPQSAVEMLEGDNEGRGGHTGRADVNEDQYQERDRSDGESGDQERGEHESDSQEIDNQGNGVPESEHRDANDQELPLHSRKVELLGQDDIWRRIIEASRKVGVSSRKGDKTRQVPPRQTECVKKIVRIIKAAAQLYDSTDGNESDNQTQEVIQSLTEHIQGLSEASCQGEEREVIEDVYAHAVPNLVKLLDKARKARKTQLANREDIAALKEVIQLQNALSTLCEQAPRWRARPTSKRPITQPTVTIRPLIKTMRNRFSEELGDRKRYLKMRAIKANKAPEIDQASSQRAWEETVRQNGARRQLIIDDCNRGRATYWGQRPAPPPQIDKPYTQPATAQLAATQDAVEDWSAEQDKALLFELLKKERKDLSADEICLEVLNAPLLQNKLPEHIRKRALCFKSAIEVVLEGRSIPKWVSAIR
ncbi:MAG: hypothetical protein Q9171_005408 [Xanthocarpia ochracea]